MLKNNFNCNKNMELSFNYDINSALPFSSKLIFEFINIKTDTYTLLDTKDVDIVTNLRVISISNRDNKVEISRLLLKLILIYSSMSSYSIFEE